MLTAAVFSVILAAAAALSFPPVDLPSLCAAMECEPGQKCEMQDVVCVQAPCNPQPVCVDAIVRFGKAWECPAPEPSQVGICAFTCNSDSDCDGDKKCCKNGCGGTNCRSPPSQIRTTPAPTRPTCATVKCGSGMTCAMKPPLDCDSDPCYPQPYCVDIEKPGKCPKSKSSYIPFGWFFCRSRCQFDADCLGDQKCCMAGCGKRCKDPVPETCATMDCPPDHTCVMEQCKRRGCSPKPVCEPVKRCPFYPMWINPNCVPRHDCVVGDPGACPVGTLCCSTDCGRRCVRPLE